MKNNTICFPLTDDELLIINDKKKRLSNSVAQLLGRRIVVNEIESDFLLPKENELCEIFGVSRTVLREAVKILADKGLIRTRQKSGTFVNSQAAWNLFDEWILKWMFERQLDMKFIEDLIELRSFIETAVVKLSALRADEADIAIMESAYLELSKAKTFDEHISADVNFHLAIFQSCKNEMFLQFKTVIKVILENSFQNQQKIMNKVSLSRSLELHEKLLNSIKEKRPDNAETIVKYLHLVAKEELFLYLKHVNTESE
ncbi:FadR family transcriptional regulator [Buttiauxella sp. A2-C2_NF]|uniref:FadR/GntR family transcriptional regulator n=1 Tax=Buttiauxella ferragutiae TaxID=82989 RepID=UPI001E3A08F2|nr:FadR/GntR family transcriptional regulator [Buttiauxella ferragutiae]MCE0827148.1 FadR family transcriptional regulator [Buttiauxella ferragutiae]